MNYLGHTAINCFTAGALSSGLYLSKMLSGGEAALFCLGFLVSTFFMGPDLDLFYSRQNKNWGILRILWWPYSKFFKHRGTSHTPLLSTVVRLVYITAVVYVLLLSFQYWFEGGGAAFAEKIQSFGSPAVTEADVSRDLELAKSFFSRNAKEAAIVSAGVVLGDFTHLVVDKVSSALKSIF